MKPIVALALLLLLAGCTAPQHSPAASAKPVSSAPHVFSATGPSQQTVTVPPGAKSAEISITCGSSDSGFVSVGVNDQDQTRDGRCPLTMRFRMAVGHTIDLSIGFGHGTGRSVTEVRFSAAPFVSDQKVADQCTGVSAAFSDMASAVNGYANGELDLAGWQKLMVSAGDKLKGVDDSGAVGTQLTALSDWYGGSELSPTHPSSDDANNASEIVNNLCLDNGTPLVISSQYGG
jgi:hypothetical protein